MSKIIIVQNLEEYNEIKNGIDNYVTQQFLDEKQITLDDYFMTMIDCSNCFNSIACTSCVDCINCTSCINSENQENKFNLKGNSKIKSQYVNK
jgi:hypothetical protein